MSLLLKCGYLQIGLKEESPKFSQKEIDNFYKLRIISTTDFYNGTPCSYSKLNNDHHNKYSGIGHNLKNLGNQRHQFSYFLHYKKIPPKGFDIHHLCGHAGCDNELHLQLLTKSKHSKITTTNRDTCKSGKHKWIPENIKTDPKTLRQHCKICQFINQHSEKNILYIEKNRGEKNQKEREERARVKADDPLGYQKYLEKNRIKNKKFRLKKK